MKQISIYKDLNKMAVLITAILFAVANLNATTYYSQVSGTPTVLSNWNSDRTGGGGSTPAGFTGEDVFVIQSGHNMTTLATTQWLIGNSTVSSVAKLQIESGGIFTGVATTATSVSQTPTATADPTISSLRMGTTATLQVDAGGKIVWITTVANSNSMAGLWAGIEALDVASIFEFRGSANPYFNLGYPDVNGYGNVILNCSGANVGINGNVGKVRGNLTVNNASGTTAYTFGNINKVLPIGGNLTIDGANLTFRGLNANGICTINVGGNVTVQNGATFVFANGATQTTTVDIAGDLTIASGSTLSGNTANNACLLTFSGSGKTFTNSGTFTTTNLNMQIKTGASLTFASPVTIATSRTLTVEGALTASGTITNNAGNTGIILKSTATNTGTLIHSTTGVSGTVEQYLTHARNYYISSPVSSAVSPSGYTYYQRDETYNSGVGSWTSQAFVAGNSSFTAGKGYIALPAAAASTMSFSGTLNTGEISIPLTKGGAGFNLIGNPYPAHLAWTKLFVESVTAPEGGIAPATLIEPSIYIRTNTGGTSNSTGTWSFQTYNAKTEAVVPNHSLLAGGKIPPMQAFWVKAKVAGNLILTSDLTKSHVTGNLLKAPAMKNTNRQQVRLEVSNGTRTDETLLLFDANALNEYDAYDSPKFAEASTEVQIFTSVENEKMVMNGMKEIPLNQEIALGFVPGSASSFSIKANEITNLPSDVKVILKDYAKNGLETDLTDGVSIYTFDAAENNTNRFGLLFRTPGNTTGIDNASNKTLVQVFVNANNQISIIAPEKSNYTIYNAMGQLMENGAITSNYQTSNFKHASGVYVVKVNNELTKVIIK